MRSLVIGYGNPSRCDDGAGRQVVNALRARWARAPLDVQSDGADELGGDRDTLILQQLTPELAELLTEYGRVIWVDAAVGELPGGVLVQRVEPHYQPALVSHHMAPPTLLALTKQLYGHAPEGWAISVAAHDMSFGDQLSAETAALVPAAVARAAELVEDCAGQ